MATIFTRIVNGEIPCYKIAEDDRFFAFLDINPMTKGHALVIPKREVDYIFDLNDNEVADMMVFAKKVAAAVEQAIPCKRIAVAVLGLQVPHAHIHLVPINSEHDVDFKHEPLHLSLETFVEIQQKITAKLQ